MKSRLLFLLKYYLFWIIFSLVAKVIFLIYQYPETQSLTGADVWLVFWKGLRIDLSLGGYIMMLSCLLTAAGEFIPLRPLKAVFSCLTALLLFICGLIVVGDLEVFVNWGYHMDATPLLYLKTPGEVLASTPTGRILFLLFLFIVYVLLFYGFYRKWVASSLTSVRPVWWHSLLYVLIGGAMIIPVRGGFNVAPMNVSFVFFHTQNMYANQAAINPVWNFLYEVTHMDKLKGDFSFMPQQEAEELLKSVYAEKGDTQKILTTERPNVVVLLLETFTLNAWDVMPNLKEIAKEGVFFSNVYATGNRSDRGLLGVISGFPAHPKVSMLKYPNKTFEQPRFPTDFEKIGYSTAFYYAGDLNFGGFRSYVTMSFQQQITENDFSGEAIENRFKWGVHDEYMLKRLAEDLTQAQSPFLYMAFTMSSHEPFEVPGETIVAGEDNDSKVKNAIAYTDRCLGAFFRECKASGIWENTLFVLLADHGTRHIGNLPPYVPEAFRIPLIFTGGVVETRDTVVETLGSQTDMIATLFGQLGMDATAYSYSKNLLDKRVVPFAFYAYSNTAAIIDENGPYILDLKSNQLLGSNTDEASGKLLKAYLQVMDQDFKRTNRPVDQSLYTE